jgi:hypothetical protein
VAPLEPSLLAAWATPAAAHPALFLPPPNAFVATEFGLKPPPPPPLAATEPLRLAATAAQAPTPASGTAVTMAAPPASLSAPEAADRVPATLVHSDPVLDVW